jgi:class 3 adenylate cyclase/tetratricopeptide (TPR) repeat protein
MIHRLVPSFILENHAAGRNRGSFPAVGLFVDISGFSTLTDVLMTHGQHGAEVLAGVMRAVMAPLIDTVFEHGGFIATQAGDAFTALFRLDELEQAPRRAVAAAWQIQQHIAARPTHATPYGEYSISAKAGLALGTTAWGIASAPDGRRAAYFFQGTAIDRCAEAEHEARAGQIVLDPALYELAQGWVTADALGAFHRLKTLAGELPARLPLAQTAVDLELASRFYPRELWVETRSGEFRQLATLFVSLPTLRTENQLELFMQTVFAIQDRYGGLLAGLDFGDKGAHLLLMWGAPTAHENDVERALNFVLELQSQTEIPINGGMTYRIAHAGFIGSDRAEEFAPYGRGVNLAARFMTGAPRGEIWLDAPAALRAQPRFTLEPMSARTFKGFAEPQMVYRLVERQELPDLAYSGRWVGRAADLGALLEFARPIFAGERAGALVVWGEPGIGKSRLVHEFLKELGQQQPDILACLAQADEILRESLNPFSYWLRSYIGITAAVADARNKRNFNRKLDDLIAALEPGRLADELDRTRSFLGALVGLRWADSLYEQVDTQARYENTLIALATLLQAESRRRPLVLIVEDAHWLDEDSRAFLPRLLRTLTAEDGVAYPIAVIVTARPYGAGLLLDDFDHADLSLGALNREAMAAQTQSHLGAPAGEGLLDMLEQRAEGNPFFAEQILRYLQDEGRLEQADGRWRVSPAGRAPLPVDVNALLVARLDRLTQDVREVVQTAAVLGREFEVRLLDSMLRDDIQLRDKVAEAEKLGIWSALSELRHIFRHALLRDAAYHMQVRARRQSLHALATQALESLYAADLRAHFGELAYHAEQAGLGHEARRYLQLAGKVAGDAYQNSLAVEYYSRALALTPPDALTEQFDLLSAREAVYALQAKQPERQQDLAALEAVARQLGQASKSVEVVVRQAVFAAAAGDYGCAARMADQAVAPALEAGMQEVAIQAYFSAADAFRNQGEFVAALPRAEAGLALARELNKPAREAGLLNLLGMIVLEQKDAQRAADYFQQSLTLCRDLGDRRGQAMPLNNLGNIAGYQGDYARAQQHFNQALAIAREIGHRAGESLLLSNLGWIAGMQGDIQQARSYAEQNLLIAREIGDRLSETYGLINLSSHAGGAGDYDTAISSARRALQLAREAHDRSAEAWAQTNLGHSLAGEGNLAGAVEAYQAALDIRTELAQPALATEPGAGLARMALARGDTASALAQVESILSHLGSGGSLDGADEPLRVYLSCYSVLAAGADERAEPVLRTAYDLLQARAGAISNEAARQSYLQNVACNREIIEAWRQHQAHELHHGSSRWEDRPG